MRIAHVINSLAPGGAERQLLGLAERSPGHEIVELGGLGRRASAVAALRARLGEVDPDVVVAWLDRSQIAVAFAKKRDIAAVASVRGEPGRSGLLRRALLRRSLGRYDLVVTNSPESAASTAAFLGRPPESVRLIPNGVEIEGVEAMPRTEGFRLAFIGRDDPAKGLDVLLAALRTFHHGEVSAVLVGHGVPEAVAHAALGVEVHAHPRVEDAWALVRPCDALVVPSRSEGSPNVVLEAFVRRLPVIGTSVGGTRSLLADGRGLLVDPDDASALSAAIRSCISDRISAEQRADAAYAFAGEHHAWPRIVALWETALADVVAR